MILRAKTKTLFEGKTLTEKQKQNSDLNLSEIDRKCTVLKSLPRRLVLELTNACNLNCVMCGRNAAKFQPTAFHLDWLQWLEPILDDIEEVTLMGWGEPTIHPDFTKMLEIINRHSARKYFCSNGMNLKNITDAIFQYKVDVFAVSVDGATAETNAKIRKGSDLNQIANNLQNIVDIKHRESLKYPYINFVFCAMKSNLHELPGVVKLAGELGLEEVKVVYLTAFDSNLMGESLWNCQSEVEKVFHEAQKLGEKLGVALKLPYIQGHDVALNKNHRDCFVSWRDFFLGSDGYVRPCMSTHVKFFKFDTDRSFMDMWNDKAYQSYRKHVNDSLKMDEACKKCYQSSHCNWNLKRSFLQYNEEFAPKWEKK
ncbi:MAG: radical SAM protein [Oscillospiraceae bacterium]|nr:radical SAM protein [Oscillospiraceae bacterium]